MTIQQDSSDDVAVDVLIAGAGPARYMAGVTLARYGVSFRLIDQRTECIQSGQAGGIQARTQELFHTLDLQYTLDSQGNHVSEAAFSSLNAQAKLARTHVGPEVNHATPYPWILAIPQRETEKAFDFDLRAKGQYLDRPTQLLSYQYTGDSNFPLQALTIQTACTVMDTCTHDLIIRLSKYKNHSLVCSNTATAACQDRIKSLQVPSFASTKDFYLLLKRSWRPSHQLI